jgi:hypothetical protein
MLAVRKVEPDDRPLLDAAAQADPFHRAAGLTGEHWAANTLMYSDADGPVVALRTTNVARVDVQFLTPDARRNAKALVEGFWTYVGVMQKKGVDELIFNSNSAAVVHFFGKRFHFRHLGGNTYSLCIREIPSGRPI